jgi:hypothetical protein
VPRAALERWVDERTDHDTRRGDVQLPLHTGRLTGRVGPCANPARVRAREATRGQVRRIRHGWGPPHPERRTCNPSPWSYHVRPPRVGQRQPRSERAE